MELSVFHTTDSVMGKSGAVPPELTDAFPWEINKTSAGVFGFDWSFGGGFPLSPGVVLSLSGVSPFSLISFSFSNNDDPAGIFPFPYNITVSDVADGQEYSFQAVPLPSTILLLGGGLIALVTLKRNVHQSKGKKR